MDIILLNKEMEESVKLLKRISNFFKEYRVTYISNNVEEIKDFIKSHSFDVVIMDEYFIDKCPEIFGYNAYKICLMENFKQSLRFTAIRKNSERALEDNLTKILIKDKGSKQEVKSLIRRELEYLGFNFALNGTIYLEEAINLIYFKNCNCNLEKEVYSQLSKRHIKTGHTIKVCIQNALNAMLGVTGYQKVIDYLQMEPKYGVGAKSIIYAVLNRIRPEMATIEDELKWF